MPDVSLIYQSADGEASLSGERLRVYPNGRVEVYSGRFWETNEIESILYVDGLPSAPAVVSADYGEVRACYRQPTPERDEALIAESAAFLLAGFRDGSVLEDKSGRRLAGSQDWAWLIGALPVSYLEFVAAPLPSAPVIVAPGPRARPSSLSH